MATMYFDLFRLVNNVPVSSLSETFERSEAVERFEGLERVYVWNLGTLEP